MAFGPDGKLYVGTGDGRIAKLTLSEDHETVVESLVSSVVADSDPTCFTNDCRTILGITFDPMDAGLPNPPVYLSHSQTFHGGEDSSSGPAINGKVSVVSGANLDSITDLITGLPVSDHDHGPCVALIFTRCGLIDTRFTHSHSHSPFVNTILFSDQRFRV